MIIEWPLNKQFHDHRDMILTSRMAVFNIFQTVAVFKILENRHFNLVNPGSIIRLKKLCYFSGNIIKVMKRRVVSKILLTA